MTRSINPMCFPLRQGRSSLSLRPCLIVLMSLPPAIPWRVALQHCPPPLHRLVSILHLPARTVKQLLRGLRLFDPAKPFSALDLIKVLAQTTVSGVQQSHVLGSVSGGRF